MRSLIVIGNYLHSPLLLVIRLFWGVLFFLTGLGKLHNIDTVITFFHSLNIPLTTFSAYLVAFIEFVGGVLLVVGFASRLIAIPLMLTMIIALFAAHTTFLTPSNIVTEAPFTFFFAALLIFVFGPGKFSIDHYMAP